MNWWCSFSQSFEAKDFTTAIQHFTEAPKTSSSHKLMQMFDFDRLSVIPPTTFSTPIGGFKLCCLSLCCHFLVILSLFLAEVEDFKLNGNFDGVLTAPGQHAMHPWESMRKLWRSNHQSISKTEPIEPVLKQLKQLKHLNIFDIFFIRISGWGRICQAEAGLSLLRAAKANLRPIQ